MLTSLHPCSKFWCFDHLRKWIGSVCQSLVEFNILPILLTIVLTDVVLVVSPVVFVELRLSIVCTNTSTPVVVFVVGKLS